jgi:hypothetical protein
MAIFIDSHKVIALKSATLAFVSAQNESISKIRIKCFGHVELKHPFSQVEGDFNLQKILKLTALP